MSNAQIIQKSYHLKKMQHTGKTTKDEYQFYASCINFIEYLDIIVQGHASLLSDFLFSLKPSQET